MTSRFKILFAVELRHAYYSDGRCLDFDFVPSEPTRRLLTDSQLVCKAFENQLWVLTRVQEDGENKDKPVVAFTPQERFVFYLKLQQPQFMNITNLDTDAFSKKRFYFSNTWQNKAGEKRYLTAPIAAYTNETEYLPGTMAATGSNVFESIKENPHGGSSRNTADAAYWQPRGHVQFATAADMLPVVGSTASFAVSGSEPFFVKAFAVNPADNQTFDREVPLRKSKALSFADTAGAGIKNVQVDLSGLVPGRYTIQINGSNFLVYVDDAAVDQEVFGIIDIHNHLPAGNEFALLDAEGKTKDTVADGRAQWLTFTIQFANRLAYLQYISLKRGISRIVDSRPEAQREYSFTPSAPSPAQSFVSNKPVPLLQKLALFNIELTHSISSEPLKAPSPHPADAGMLSRTGNDFFSTVYLNY